VPLNQFQLTDGQLNTLYSETYTFRNLPSGETISIDVFVLWTAGQDSDGCDWGAGYQVRGSVQPTTNTNFFAAGLIDISENDAYTLYAVLKSMMSSLETDATFFYPSDTLAVGMAKTLYYYIDSATPTGDCPGNFVILPLSTLYFIEEPTEDNEEPELIEVEQVEEVGEDAPEPEETEAPELPTLEESLEDLIQKELNEQRLKNYNETGFYETNDEREAREKLLSLQNYDWVEVGDYNGDIKELYDLAVQGKGPFEVFITDGNFSQKMLSVVGIYELPGLSRPSSDSALIEKQSLQLKVKENYRVSMQLYAQINVDENTTAEQTVDILFEKGDQLYLNPAKIADKYGRLNNNINQGIPFLQIKQDGQVVFEDENITGTSLESISYYKDTKRGLALQDIENLFQISASSIQKYMISDRNLTPNEPAGYDANGYPYWIDENGEATYSPTYTEGSVGREDMEDDTPTTTYTGTPDQDPYAEDEEGISTGTLSFIGLISFILVGGIIWFTFKSKGGGANVGSGSPL
tara:strand:- start:1254 stop:2819 length:1566 start_codon:yes stop_codon:yes gene_type:complete